MSHYTSSASASDLSDDEHHDQEGWMTSSPAMDDFGADASGEYTPSPPPPPRSSSSSLSRQASLSVSDTDCLPSTKYRRICHEPAAAEVPLPDAVATFSSSSAGTTPSRRNSRRQNSAQSKQQSFIQKLYKMACCPDHANVFGFSVDGSAVEIRNPGSLGPVLVRYFKHGNTSSFIRQLNNYGFKTISSSTSGKSNVQSFAHPQFHRDAKDVVDQITRKTARILKKCKREIIRDLQTEEQEQRRRLRDLEVRNQELERHSRMLELENHRLRGEVHQLQQIIVPSRHTGAFLGSGGMFTCPSDASLPSLVSNASRRSSFEPDHSDDPDEHPMDLQSGYLTDEVPSAMFYSKAVPRSSSATHEDDEDMNGRYDAHLHVNVAQDKAPVWNTGAATSSTSAPHLEGQLFA